jgi:hypothetical protein
VLGQQRGQMPTYALEALRTFPGPHHHRTDTANPDEETRLKVKFCNAQTASFDCAGEAGVGGLVRFFWWGGSGGVGLGQQRGPGMHWKRCEHFLAPIMCRYSQHGWGDQPQSEVLQCTNSQLRLRW